jgi:Flp pilus assembly protein TadD
MLGWVLAAAIALGAQDPPAPQEHVAPAPSELLAMPPELKAWVRTEIVAGRPTAHERLERITRFVSSTRGLGITYQGAATTSVAETYATRRTNCLGFTLLFLALAREAGLRAFAQDAGETPVWRDVGGTIIRSDHVNAGVIISGERYTLDVAGEAVFRTHPPQFISDEMLFARYYNNVAIAHLMQGQPELARQEMALALELDPRDSQQWSNAGVLALHEGDIPAARRAYAAALSLDASNASALLNLVTLARRTGDTAGEASWRRRLERVQRRDPVHQFILGLDAERSGDYPRAITQYRRAIRLHRGEHRFYSALGRAYLLAGDAQHATRAFAQASRYSDGLIRAAYQDELQKLRAAE